MATCARWVLVPALLGWLAVATPVLAQQTRSEYVNDEAGLFSKEAKVKANADLARLRSQFKKELVVDTVMTVKRPANVDKDDNVAVDRFFDDLAQKRFGQERVNGSYILIVQTPPKVRVRLGNETQRLGIFTEADRQELQNRVVALLKEAKQDEMKNQVKNDRVLAEAVSFVHERMSQHARQTAGQRQAPAAPNQPQHEEGTPWVTYLLIGVGVFLVLWFVMGLIRAASGSGSSPGMAGAGGGGGGGFFSSLLGGMFGAAAGMWLYSNFFGGHTNTAYGAGPDAGASNVDTGSTGGGDDYGDTGGDQGGGGGDVGGGDWGGGGGGDWGGGGGDFGGGGGGGDW
jgi:hypothetical protein